MVRTSPDFRLNQVAHSAPPLPSVADTLLRRSVNRMLHAMRISREVRKGRIRHVGWKYSSLIACFGSSRPNARCRCEYRLSRFVESRVIRAVSTQRLAEVGVDVNLAVQVNASGAGQ